MNRIRMAAAVLGFAAVAGVGCAAAPAGAAVEHYDGPAASIMHKNPDVLFTLRNGNGTDLGFPKNIGHTGEYGSINCTGACETFTQINPSGGAVELQAFSSGECITQGPGANELTAETCSGSAATYWVRDGLLWRAKTNTSELLYAGVFGSCNVAGTASYRGGQPETCNNEWNA